MTEAIFRIEMLPACEGDALLIEYGKSNKLNKILIDAGPLSSFAAVENKMNALHNKDFELVVVTHVDTDHIDGIIRLFGPARGNWLINPKEIWFNGLNHVRKFHNLEMLGGIQGDYLSAVISKRANEIWNKSFKSGAIVADESAKLPSIKLEGGMQITILSPNRASLKKLAPVWEKDVKKHHIKPGDIDAAFNQLVNTGKYKASDLLGADGLLGGKLTKQLGNDPSEANGSSIGFLAEYSGKSCLFFGDAHQDVLCDSLKKIVPIGNRLKVDAVKMPHHASKNNISKDLISMIDAKYYLVSTNGDKHSHPDKEAIETVINNASAVPTLCFNYDTKTTKTWKTKSKKYNAEYPGQGASGLVIEL